MESMGWKSLVSSLFVCAVVTIMISPVITQAVVKPLVTEQRLVSFGRYAFASQAIDSIAEDDSLSVVGIGSSMMYKAFDGKCMEQLSDIENSNFYNLGVPASRPYTDMMQIPRLSNSGVEVVLVEVGANLLFKMSEGPHEYLQLRFTVQTMIQDSSDIGPWTDIILPYHQKWVYTNEYERTIAQMMKALDRQLETVILFTDPDFAHMHSTVVRDIIRNGGDASAFVPEVIAAEMILQS